MAKCDMCDGSGKMQTYKTVDNHQIYGTTAAGSAEREYNYIQDGLKDGTVVLVDVPCQTCSGSGILPVYLEPGYWQGRSDELEVQHPSSQAIVPFLTRIGKWIFGG